ncbi:hypothetical protein [Streptomyces cupreus]|uniref:Uncharacterized protein n=1 Tax=Streptomyces cupreus TaxID=2759956 RepID=A0A7X1IYH7_9ACTN|nr:hypothetical protein [Streptomyces cupreus]MBC2900245.1 hypothetical protein [Streptomyces cupreus]
MAMVGLFWITEDSVYVGAEPAGTASGVRLSKDGVEALGLEHGGSWSWEEVRRIEVADVTVRPASRRWVSQAIDVVAVALTGDGELPPAFTVRITTTDETVEVSVLSAVAGGIYGPVEYELSRTLLGRLVDGRTDLEELLLWRRDRVGETGPGREEREALMLKWIGDRDPS